MPKRSKHEYFMRIADRRTNHVLESLEALGNCSNPATYEYSREEIEQIFAAIESKIVEVRSRLEFKSPYGHVPFRLSDVPEAVDGQGEV